MGSLGLKCFLFLESGRGVAGGLCARWALDASCSWSRGVFALEISALVGLSSQTILDSLAFGLSGTGWLRFRGP